MIDQYQLELVVRGAKILKPKERKWCVENADKYGEGYYTQEELEEMNDKNLANAVLNAMDMYVKSQLG